MRVGPRVNKKKRRIELYTSQREDDLYRCLYSLFLS